MQPLNAIDAIAPAFTRTHETLFEPFRFGRSWKLCASQYLGFCGAMFVPLPLFVFLIPSSAFGGFAVARAAALLITLAFTLVGLVFLYLFARMELVAFEMLVTRAKFIAPMWRRYSARVWPWLGFKLLVGTVYSAVILAIFYSPIKHLFTDLAFAFPAHSFPAGSNPDPEAIQAMQASFGPWMAHIANLELLLYAILFLLKIPSTLLNDFVLPYFVLEPIPLLVAVGRGFQVFVADPLHVILYLILKPILFIIGSIMQTIALMITMVPIFIIFFIVAITSGVMIHHSTGGAVTFGVGLILGYLAFFAFIMYLSFFLHGYLLALLEAYGIYFLGGRYPLLGSMLEPGPGGPFTPPPVFPSSEEQQDEDGGPPMPMNPAVA